MDTVKDQGRTGLTPEQVLAVVGEICRFSHRLDNEIEQCDQFGETDLKIIQLRSELIGMKTAVNVISSLLVEMDSDASAIPQLNLSVPA